MGGMVFGVGSVMNFRPAERLDRQLEWVQCDELLVEQRGTKRTGDIIGWGDVIVERDMWVARCRPEPIIECCNGVLVPAYSHLAVEHGITAEKRWSFEIQWVTED